MQKKYLDQDLNNPKYLFHGSPILLDRIEVKKSHDSNGVKDNIDMAVFLTSSFLVATAYSFKDKIKERTISNGLSYSFIVNNQSNLPIMIMENVVIPESLEGYVYVFEYSKKFINKPAGSLQYKSHDDLVAIDIIKVNYEDFKEFYQIKEHKVVFSK